MPLQTGFGKLQLRNDLEFAIKQKGLDRATLYSADADGMTGFEQEMSES
jgi:hypothetical protein